MKSIFLILIAAFFITSCQHNSFKNDNLPLVRDTLITQFSDSSFFSDIRSIYCNDFIYLTDYQRNQIIKLDKSGTMIKCLSEKGMGPGELQGASDIFATEDSIFVINEFKQCLELFSNNNHIKSIYIPSKTMLAVGTRFAYYRNTIYISSASDKNSLVAINVNDGTLNYMGKLIDFGSSNKNIISNNRHVFINNEKVITVSNCAPLIEMYDLSGELVFEYDLTGIEIIDARLDYAKTLDLGPNSYVIMVSDAFIFDNKLHLLITSNDESGPNAKRILVFDINKKNFTLSRILNLGNGWFNTFCVTEDHLWAVSQEGINRFSLD